VWKNRGGFEGRKRLFYAFKINEIIPGNGFIFLASKTGFYRSTFKISNAINVKLFIKQY